MPHQGFPMPSPFENDTAARELLEALRWPDGARCQHCGAHGAAVTRLGGGGEKPNPREGLYQCNACRRQFSVTVGTVFERQRIPLSTWIVAAREFGAAETGRGGTLAPLNELQTRIGVSYLTVLRMRDIIERAAKNYKGYLTGFGSWPRSLMKSRAPSHRDYHRKRDKLLAAGKHPRQHAVKSSGLLADMVSARKRARAPMDRTEALLRLLLATPKKTQRKRRAPVNVYLFDL